MSEGESRDPETPGSAEVSWLRLSDGLIAGIHHALNNRMAALGAAGQLLEADLPAGHPLGGLLSGEVQRMENTATLLRLLTEGDTEPQPVQVADTLKEAKDLLAIHHDLRDVSLEVACQSGLLPLWTEPSSLLRAILLSLAVAAGRGNGSRRSLRMEVSGDESYVYIDITGTGNGTGTGGETPLGPNGMAGISALAKKMDGRFSAANTDEAVKLRLTLPTLVEVRRRGNT